VVHQHAHYGNTSRDEKNVTELYVVFLMGLVPIFSHVISDVGQYRYFRMVERLQKTVLLSCLKFRKEELAGAKGLCFAYLRVVFLHGAYPREGFEGETRG
jgi:hypothetical protein